MSKIALNQRIKLSLMIVTLGITSGIHAVADAQEASPIFGDITINQKFSPDPLTVRGMSGGSVAGNKVAGRSETPTGPCTGFVGETPGHTFKLTSGFEYLKLLVQSPQDTTLIVKGPGGTWCNDDFDGKNPGIVGEWLPGDYQIWVGSYEKDKYFPYTLQITQVN
ncbi:MULTISPECIES: hypothetical protein [unclassified Nodularia (in: cyanobacteria)]|uniref:hypothetical protein n=1 Tax=unclassified Nodularia (in: cyanobacteria) TaxID=2656917 RepID=UPI001882BF1B|nr:MULTISPECIES: hypothetical protein [unclassified Nodularia (in: cyanobacteria)]MBE9199481.1 hypothetical protein [Nodularia sp. LEGE 06071]MCC2691294.1 hypothetical protein [Nodularia sp. LEGE 04288]